MTAAIMEREAPASVASVRSLQSSHREMRHGKDMASACAGSRTTIAHLGIFL